MKSSFSIKEALSYGWNTFKKQWKFLVPYFAVIIVVQIFLSYLGGEKSPLPVTLAFIVHVIATIISIFFSASIIKTMLVIHENQSVTLSKNLFIATRKDAWRYFKTGLVFMLYMIPVLLPVVVISLLTTFSTPTPSILPIFGLLVLGTIIAMLVLTSSLIFSYYVSFDHTFKIFENLKYSWKITKDNRWKLVQFSLLSFLIIILGLICFIVGIIVAIPVIQIATVHIYKKLNAQYQKVHGKHNNTVHVHKEVVADTHIDTETGVTETETVETVEIKKDEEV